MSTLFVDTITEKTSGNGVQIPGHVVQVKQVSWTSTANTSSTSYVNLGEIGSITTTAVNSKILVMTNIPLQVASTDNRYELELRHSLDSYVSSLERHIPVNYSDASGGWVQPHLGWNCLHDAQQAAGTTIYYRTYTKKVVGSSAAYYVDTWGQSPDYKCILMEIAQ